MRTMLAAAAMLLLGAGTPADPELTAAKVAALPEIDGKADDAAWKQAKELIVKIGPPQEDVKAQVSLKAVHDGDSICFLAVWEDETENKTHKMKMWTLTEEKYMVTDDSELEDAFSIAFPLTGKFDTDMLAPVLCSWDVWEWGAFYSSGGFAKDKVHYHTRAPIPDQKGKQFRDRDGGTLVITRPFDEGTIGWKEVDPPKTKGPDRVPTYVLQTPTGSAADVRARGVWADGKWTVEFRRKLATGHKDDVVLDVSKPIEFAIATFDSVEKAEHLVSPKLLLKFGK